MDIKEAATKARRLGNRYSKLAKDMEELQLAIGKIKPGPDKQANAKLQTEVSYLRNMAHNQPSIEWSSKGGADPLQFGRDLIAEYLKKGTSIQRKEKILEILEWSDTTELNQAHLADWDSLLQARQYGVNHSYQEAELSDLEFVYLDQFEALGIASSWS